MYIKPIQFHTEDILTCNFDVLSKSFKEKEKEKDKIVRNRDAEEMDVNMEGSLVKQIPDSDDKENIQD